MLSPLAACATPFWTACAGRAWPPTWLPATARRRAARQQKPASCCIPLTARCSAWNTTASEEVEGGWLAGCRHHSAGTIQQAPFSKAAWPVTALRSLSRRSSQQPCADLPPAHMPPSSLQRGWAGRLEATRCGPSARLAAGLLAGDKGALQPGACCKRARAAARASGRRDRAQGHGCW